MTLTADALSGAEEKYLSLGFDGYMCKPFSREMIAKKLYAVFSNEKPKSAAASVTAAAEAKKTGESEFDQAIRALDLAVDNITHRKSIIGSAGNRMDSALQTLTTQYENLSSAKSIITDADVAAEASNFTQQQILQQVSTSLLAQANQAPSIALSLI